MAKLQLQQFTGELPRTQAHYLPDNHAVIARNAKLTGGSIRPMRGGALRQTFPTAGKVDVVLHGTEWFGFEYEVDAAPGPVATDRLYLTRAGGEPQIHYGGAWWPLALATPTDIPSVSRDGTLDDSSAYNVAYAFTWVTELGEESGPSPLSASIKFSSGTSITVGNMPSATSVGGRPVQFKRIYRARTATSGATELFLIKEVAASTASFVDSHGANPDMEAIPSKEFDPPPSDLRGLTVMPNGMMAGFTGKELHFCHPYQPHAWPSAYSQVVNDQIIGLCAFGSSLAVITNSNPWLVQGLSPDQMAMTKVEAMFPCVAKRSIVDMGYAAVYASPLGLVQIGEGGANLVSNGIWSKDEWELMQPSTIQAARYGLAYIMSYLPPESSIRKVAIVNLNGDQPTLVHCDVIAKGFYADPTSNRTYFLDDTGKFVHEFDAGDLLTYTWRSKPYRFSEPIPLGAAKIELAENDPTATGDGSYAKVGDLGQMVILAGPDFVSQTEYTMTISVAPEEIEAEASYSALLTVKSRLTLLPITVRFFGDGNLRHSVSPKPGQIMRLPEGSHREWQIEIIGQAEVLRVVAAHTIEEAGL